MVGKEVDDFSFKRLSKLLHWDWRLPSLQRKSTFKLTLNYSFRDWMLLLKMRDKGIQQLYLSMRFAVLPRYCLTPVVCQDQPTNLCLLMLCGTLWNMTKQIPLVTRIMFFMVERYFNGYHGPGDYRLTTYASCSVRVLRESSIWKAHHCLWRPRGKSNYKRLYPSKTNRNQHWTRCQFLWKNYIENEVRRITGK